MMMVGDFRLWWKIRKSAEIRGRQIAPKTWCSDGYGSSEQRRQSGLKSGGSWIRVQKFSIF